MKILFLSRWFPYPINNGSKVRIHSLLRGLAKHHDVTLLSFADLPAEELDLPQAQSLCSAVHIVPWREFNPQSWRARFGFLGLKPRSIVDTFSSEMATTITKLVNENQYDLVIASQLSMAAYRSNFKDIPAMFEEVEIGLSLGKIPEIKDFKKRVRHAFTWFKLRMYLSRLLGSFQVCTVASKKEQQLLAGSFPMYANKIEVVPNCILVNEYKNQQAALVPHQLIFTGSFRYRVNYDAMLWFVQEVYPRVLEQVPNAHLIITGDHANLSLPLTRNLTLAGYVDDIKTLVASSWLSIAPLLSGGGTRLKILEAMASGTPVVSTSKGAEGLGALVGEHLLVADEPHAFANCVVKILTDKDLHDQIAANAFEFVKKEYDWASTLPHFLQLVENTPNHR